MKTSLANYMKQLSKKEVASYNINSNIKGLELVNLLKNKEKKCLSLKSNQINLL